jgi:hypothetical protein
MKKYIIIFSLSLISNFSECFASIDSSQAVKWTPEGAIGLNASQIAFKDWSQGGENAVSWSVFFNLGLKIDFQSWRLSNKIKTVFGMTQTGETDFRTNENDLFFETALSYKMSWAVDPYLSNSIRSSIVDGYNYKTAPATKIATFFDPGYITQSIGFSFDKLKGLNTRMGLAFQEIFAYDFHQYVKDRDGDSTKRFRFETGIESVSSYEIAMDSTIKYKGDLRLFGRFDKLDVWDLRFENTLVAKINKFFNVNLNVLLVQQLSQSTRLQLKEALRLGVAFDLF